MLKAPEPEKCLIKDLGESEACIKLFEEHADNQRQRHPLEQDNSPTPAMAPVRWNEERYSL
ncbi:hypothetical protein D3C77_736580 [compost metagenome]